MRKVDIDHSRSTKRKRDKKQANLRRRDQVLQQNISRVKSVLARGKHKKATAQILAERLLLPKDVIRSLGLKAQPTLLPLWMQSYSPSGWYH